MSDCRNSLAVNKLVDYPVIRKLWFYHPGVRRWFGEVCKWLFPFGLPVYLIRGGGGGQKEKRGGGGKRGGAFI